MFKRLMVLGAVASALVFTGCQNRSRQDQGARGAGEQTQPATGGSGQTDIDSTIPGGSNTIGGTRQDARPGVELGGTGSSGGSINDNSGAGGSGSLDQSGVGGSGSKKTTPKKGPMDAGTPGGTDAGM